MQRIKRKRYVIKSKFRFTVFLAVILLISVTTVTALLGMNDASGMTKQQYTQIQVYPGDTLWSIACEHMSDDMDIREAVHILSKVNQISASQLYAGQIIKIPVAAK